MSKWGNTCELQANSLYIYHNELDLGSVVDEERELICDNKCFIVIGVSYTSGISNILVILEASSTQLGRALNDSTLVGKGDFVNLPCTREGVSY